MSDPKIIEHRGRRYYYCEGDDCWYPVPTKDQYDFQRFVIFMGSLVLLVWLCSLLF